MVETEQILNYEDRLKIFDDLLPAKIDSVPKRRIFQKISKNNTESTALTGYTCDLCSKHFKRELQYYGHLQKHSGERIWECEKCLENSTFSTQSQLRWHEQKFHIQQREYKCTHSGCNKSYGRPSHLEYHTRRAHLNERNIDCKICDKRFFTTNDLKTHLNTHLGTNKKICERCGQSFHHVSNFLRHIRKHDGIKPYQCEKCDKRFSEVTILRKHMLHHDNEKINVSDKKNSRKFYCFVCGKTFQYLYDVRQHEIIHEIDKTVFCKSCSTSFSTIKDIKIHNCSFKSVNVKNTDETNNIGHEENSSFNLTSDWTQIMNGLLSQLDIELENDHQNILPITNDHLSYNSTISNDPKPNPIDTTDYNDSQTTHELLLDSQSELQNNSDVNCVSKTNLDLEQLANIKDDFLKQNVCKICGATFAHNSSMYRHLRNHSSTNFVNCDYCNKKLTADSLYTHIRRIHKKEKTFMCSSMNCGKVFFKHADLVIHKRSHTNERPFKCKICFKSFISSSHQVRHEKTHREKNT